MKKHEMVLDFTSLLDVILIILFLVLCSMNGKAQKDAKKIDDLEASNVVLSGEIEQLTGRVDNLEQQNTELSEKVDEALQASLEKGQEVDRLMQENAKLEELLETATQLAKTYEKMNGMNAADAKRYELLQGNSISVEIMLTDPDPKFNPGHQCKITLSIEGLRHSEYLLENTEDTTDKIEKESGAVVAWLKQEINKVKKSEEINLVFLGMPLDRNDIGKTANNIVDEAVRKLMQQDLSIILYTKE